jgi:hydrogenase maturation protein HypF
MWLERLASHSPTVEPYPFPFAGGELDFRPLLQCMLEDRLNGRDTREIARAFQRGIAVGVTAAAAHLCSLHETDTLVLSGGVFQNDLLLRDLKDLFESRHLQVWTNHQVPANDGGISLGQAALAALATVNPHASIERRDTAGIAASQI